MIVFLGPFLLVETPVQGLCPWGRFIESCHLEDTEVSAVSPAGGGLISKSSPGDSLGLEKLTGEYQEELGGESCPAVL